MRGNVVVFAGQEAEQMPGRHEVLVAVPGAPGVGVAEPRSGGARSVLPRLLAVAFLVAAVGVIAGLAGYARGRGSVDQEALRVQAFAAGRDVGARVEAARRSGALAAVPHGAAGAAHVRSGARTSSSSVLAARAELSRAFAAGRRQGLHEASFAERAHGRALGATAALGGFASGWATGRWYIVRLAPGGTLTGGRPRLASRIGPLAPGRGYAACRGGGAVCRVGGGT